jgi:hypothetical protein
MHENSTDGNEQVSQDRLEALFKLAHSGSSPDAISFSLKIDIETVQQAIANDPKQRTRVVQSIKERSEEYSEEQSQKAEANALNRAEISLQDTRETLHIVTLPTFIYSYEELTGQLHRTSLVTGEQSSHQVPSYTFKACCCWSEVSGGSLLITGGLDEEHREVREVVRIDTRRESAVVHCPPMLTPRVHHAAVYHTPHLYILGGFTDSRRLSECERYMCAENRWEELPPLP